MWLRSTTCRPDQYLGVVDQPQDKSTLNMEAPNTFVDYEQNITFVGVVGMLIRSSHLLFLPHVWLLFSLSNTTQKRSITFEAVHLLGGEKKIFRLNQGEKISRLRGKNQLQLLELN